MIRYSQYQNKDGRVSIYIELHDSTYVTIVVDKDLLSNNLKNGSKQELLQTIDNIKNKIK